MALIQKTNPVGLDKAIDLFQSYLYTTLGYADWESYHRVYLNPKRGGALPEAYLADGDYKEVLFDDTFSITSFFLASSNEEIDEGISTVNVSMIVQANLVDLYPSVTHRADEELHNAIRNASTFFQNYDQFKLIRIVTGVDNVYSEVLNEDVQLDDMSEHHVCRFEYEVKFEPQCV